MNPPTIFGYDRTSQPLNSIPEFGLSEYTASFTACLIMLKLESFAAAYPGVLTLEQTARFDHDVSPLLNHILEPMFGKYWRCGTISQLGVKRFWSVITREPVILRFIANKKNKGPSKELITICGRYIRSEQFVLPEGEDISKVGMYREWNHLLESAAYWASQYIPPAELETILEGTLEENVEEARRRNEHDTYER